MKYTNRLVIALTCAMMVMGSPVHADSRIKAGKPGKKFSEITARDLEKTIGNKKNQDFQGFEESDHRLLHMNTNVDPGMAELAKPREHHYIERKFE